MIKLIIYKEKKKKYIILLILRVFILIIFKFKNEVLIFDIIPKNDIKDEQQ